MIRSFWFVTTRSFKNRMLSRLRKLRTPRYAVSFAAGLAYLWFVAFRRMIVNPGRGFSGVPVSGMIVDGVSILAFVAMLLVWAIPDQAGGLTFSEAEIQFLFPAPVTRRQLLLYKIFRQQPAILISAVMMTLFGFRHSKFIGLWLAFVAMSVYFTMVALARARLKVAGIGFVTRLFATIIAGGAALTFIIRDVRTPSAVDIMNPAGSLFRTPLIPNLLLIPRIFASAAFPINITTLAVSCGALVVLGLIFFAIAARLNVSFEEASVEASVKQAQSRGAMRSGRFGNRIVFRRARLPFHLSERSGPELSIVWKNVTASLRMSMGWMIVVLAVFGAFIVDAAIARRGGIQMGGAALGLLFAGFFPFLGSQALRQDLRLDLPRIELLKSYPIRGDRLVLAEIAGPALIVSFVEMILLTATAILSHAIGTTGSLKFVGTPEFIVIALLFAIPVCAAQLVIQNAVAILLPGWAIQSPEESRGFVVLGQRLVILGGNLLVLAVGLIPAAIVFVPLFLLTRHYGSNAFVLAISTAPAIAVLVAEIWVAIHFLGAQFDEIDITNEIDAAV